MSDEQKPSLNTDRELWRKNPGDYYSPSIHVTAQGTIGIAVGGTVHVMSVKKWHALASAARTPAVMSERVERRSGNERRQGRELHERPGVCGKWYALAEFPAWWRGDTRKSDRRAPAAAQPDKDLQTLVDTWKCHARTAEEREAQRQSWARGEAAMKESVAQPVAPVATKSAAEWLLSRKRAARPLPEDTLHLAARTQSLGMKSEDVDHLIAQISTAYHAYASAPLRERILELNEYVGALKMQLAAARERMGKEHQ